KARGNRRIAEGLRRAAESQHRPVADEDVAAHRHGAEAERIEARARRDDQVVRDVERGTAGDVGVPRHDKLVVVPGERRPGTRADRHRARVRTRLRRRETRTRDDGQDEQKPQLHRPSLVDGGPSLRPSDLNENPMQMPPGRYSSRAQKGNPMRMSSSMYWSSLTPSRTTRAACAI